MSRAYRAQDCFTRTWSTSSTATFPRRTSTCRRAATFPEGFEIAPEPKSWLYSTNHAAATLSFGVKDGKKNVLIDTDSTYALDLSVAQRQQLERRYKGPETGDWILDLSRMG